MVKVSLRAGAVALALSVVAFFCLHTGPAARAQSSAEDLRVKRRTPIVAAVQKVRDGILTLKVSKSDGYSTKSVAGTGVIVDERGFAITNHHVVADAEKIQVTFADKSTCEARVIHEEPSHDLAILRLVIKNKVKALTFGPGSDLEVGETVIAIGNPYGFANTVTTGIISALDREITMPSGDTLKNLIQTNASINPGNSGGPLVNINGEVIGINVALREGAQGIAFALNADSVKRVLRRHLSAAKISKITHGLRIRESVIPEGKTRQQVIVDRERGDVKKGDVVVKVGNLAVSNGFDLERGFWGYKPGEKVKTLVLREGKPTSLEIPVAAVSEVQVTSATTDGSKKD